MKEEPMKGFQYVQNRDCEFFPCHQGEGELFNCLFCYCPLYALGKDCGGHFKYLENGIKSCENCMIPHQKGGYEYIQQRIGAVIRLAKETGSEEADRAENGAD